MSFVDPKISTKHLAQICRHVGISLEAGLDARSVWKKESQRGSASVQRHTAIVSEQIEQGATAADALNATGEYFPTLMREMVRMGEESGSLDRVFLRMADHYEESLKLRRMFMASIAWPMIELLGAVVVIGVFILVLGIIGVDPLGWGITGVKGLAIYLLFVGAIASGIGAVIWGTARGWLWVAPLQKLAVKLPGLGHSLKTLSLARLTWTMALTTNSSMDVRRALRLAQQATGNAYYTEQADVVDGILAQGKAIHVAMRAASVYPDDLVDAIETGETAGQLPEAMNVLSRQYEDKAKRAFGVIAMVAGFAVYGLVALLIIILIFTIFQKMYLGPINEMLDIM